MRWPASSSRRWRLVELVLYKAYADLRAESERTYLGFAWWAIEPILSMAVYYLVFAVILDRGTPHFVAFLFVGLVPWRWLATGTLHGAGSILKERSLMQQVHLPKWIFPLVLVLADTAKFLVVFAILLVSLWMAGFAPSSAHAALPLVLAAQFLLVAGCSMLAGAVVPFLPDLKVILENLIRLWLFLSGIFYDVSTLPSPLREVLRLNPMVVLLEAYREILLEGTWPHLPGLVMVAASGCLLCGLAVWVLRRKDLDYAKLTP